MMRYPGGKHIVGSWVAPVIQSFIKGNQTYIEPFVGSCSVMYRIKAKRKVGYDLNGLIIDFWNALLYGGWQFPKRKSKWLYARIKANPEQYDPALICLYKYGLSFRGLPFAGFAKDHFDNRKGRPLRRIRDSLRSAKVSCVTKTKGLVDVELSCLDYRRLKPFNSVIYCDPPYIESGENERFYDLPGEFDHEEFYEWSTDVARNNTVLVSESTLPKNIPIRILYSKVRGSSITNHAKTIHEYLFQVLG